MGDRTDANPVGGGEYQRDGRQKLEATGVLAQCSELRAKLYEESGAERFGLSREQFFAAIERGVRKRFAQDGCTREAVEGFLATLHVADLALAAACEWGSESAWEQFVSDYREYLRAAAGAVLRCSSETPRARELADPLFADLFGLRSAGSARASLFRYFHGRSALKTWLRAILAQRNIDAIRASKNQENVDDGEPGKIDRIPVVGPLSEPDDPRRSEYDRIFQQSLEMALREVTGRDRERLRLYYAEEKTLAQISKTLGEHESSVSRNLERVRRELKIAVEALLRSGKFDGGRGMSDAQVSLCLEYGAEVRAEGVRLDFEKLFGDKQAGRQES